MLTSSTYEPLTGLPELKEHEQPFDHHQSPHYKRRKLTDAVELLFPRLAQAQRLVYQAYGESGLCSAGLGARVLLQQVCPTPRRSPFLPFSLRL